MEVLKVFITLFVLGAMLNLLKKRHGILACGLIGYCGGKPADPWILRLLFLYNLKRGEHATGISIDGTIFKATVPANKFLAEQHQLFNSVADTKSNFTIIGHDRQASSGSKDKLELAHPHGILKEGSDTEYKLILAHNGTINNIWAMGEKYDCKHEYNVHSDSLTLAKILAKSTDAQSIEVLKGYTGTATILFSTPRFKNTIFVHRDPERELFYWQKAEDEMYISSIKESLLAVGGAEETVQEFKSYELTKITKGKLGKVWDTKEGRKAIDYASSDPKVHSSNPHKGNSNSYINRNYRNLHNGAGYSDGSYYCAENDAPFRGKTKESKPSNGFRFFEGLYYLNGHAFTGIMYASELENRYSRQPVKGYELYRFVGGLMCKDEASYDKLYQLSMTSTGFDADKFKKLFACDQARYSMYPVKAIAGIAESALFFPHKFHSTKYVEQGNANIMAFAPLFSPIVYRITMRGTLVSTIDRKREEPVEYQEVKTTVESTLKTTIKNTISETVYPDIAAAFTAVRTSMGGNDDTTFFLAFVDAFVRLCDEDGVYPDGDVEGFIQKCSSGLNHKTVYDSLSQLLEMYNLYLKECMEKEGQNEVIAGMRLEEFRQSNKFATDENFINEIAMVKHRSLDAIIVKYAPTDADDDTRPVLHAVILEMNRQGVLSDKEAYKICMLTPAKAYRELDAYYEIYINLKDDSTTHIDDDEIPEDGLEFTSEVNCCGIKTPTDLLAEAFIRCRQIDSMKKRDQTASEQEELEKLKSKIADTLVHADGVIDENYMTDKYGFNLQLISEEYA